MAGLQQKRKKKQSSKAADKNLNYNFDIWRFPEDPTCFFLSTLTQKIEKISLTLVQFLTKTAN